VGALLPRVPKVPAMLVKWRGAMWVLHARGLPLPSMVTPPHSAHRVMSYTTPSAAINTWVALANIPPVLSSQPSPSRAGCRVLHLSHHLAAATGIPVGKMVCSRWQAEQRIWTPEPSYAPCLSCGLDLLA
jgi:hypothetical protein